MCEGSYSGLCAPKRGNGEKFPKQWWVWGGEYVWAVAPQAQACFSSEDIYWLGLIKTQVCLGAEGLGQRGEVHCRVQAGQ